MPKQYGPSNKDQSNKDANNAQNADTDINRMPASNGYTDSGLVCDFWGRVACALQQHKLNDSFNFGRPKRGVLN